MQGSPSTGAARPPRPTPSHGLYHGGDLASAQTRFGRHRWLDLSTGINPMPYPLPALPKRLSARLPDGDLLAALSRAAAAAYGLDDPAALAAGAGSQAFIQLIPRLVPAGRVLIVGPTYGEHAAAWAAAGHRVMTVAAAEVEGALGQAETLILAHPNNPDGRRYDVARLRDWRVRLAAAGGRLVIDEAFADLTPELSLAPEAAQLGLIVLRSFGKFFGLAGLRLGFALSAPDFAARLRAALGPWPVSGPAAYVGARALQDGAWIAATRAALGQRAAALDEILATAGLEIAGGTDLFRLVATDDAAALFEHLGRRGILVRDFPDAPRLLRFGLPGSAAAFTRLRRALTTKRTRAFDLAALRKSA